MSTGSLTAGTALPYRPGRPGPVWVDADAYCRDKLLGGGPVPWGNPGEYASYVARSVALTASDAALVDVGAAWSTRLADADLVTAMSRQTRRGRPLRALLDDAAGQALVAEVLRTAVAAARVPVVAVVPSPARWARACNVVAGLADEPVDEDTLDAAAMYVAGALTGFAGLGVTALLVDEADAAADALPGTAAYEPIANAAGHLGWPVLVRTDAAACWPTGPAAGVSGWVGAAPPAQAAPDWGLVTPLAASLPDGSPGAARIVVVAADADPDVVTATVRSWD